MQPDYFTANLRPGNHHVRNASGATISAESTSRDYQHSFAKYMVPN